MNLRRKIAIAVSLTLVLVFISYTTYSSYTEPQNIEPFYINNAKAVDYNSLLSPGTSNYSFPVKSGDNFADIYVSFLAGDLFDPLWNTTNISTTNYFGNYLSTVLLSVTYANASVSGALPTFSFYLSNYTFQTNFPYLLMPMQIAPYYTSAVVISYGKTITPSHGFYVGSRIPFFNYTGLYGMHTFWLNMTINPYVSYGPYYSNWSPVRVSFWWTEDLVYVN